MHGERDWPLGTQPFLLSNLWYLCKNDWPWCVCMCDFVRCHIGPVHQSVCIRARNWLDFALELHSCFNSHRVLPNTHEQNQVQIHSLHRHLPPPPHPPIPSLGTGDFLIAVPYSKFLLHSKPGVHHLKILPYFIGATGIDPSRLSHNLEGFEIISIVLRLNKLILQLVSSCFGISQSLYSYRQTYLIFQWLSGGGGFFRFALLNSCITQDHWVRSETSPQCPQLLHVFHHCHYMRGKILQPQSVGPVLPSAYSWASQAYGSFML